MTYASNAAAGDPRRRDGGTYNVVASLRVFCPAESVSEIAARLNVVPAPFLGVGAGFVGPRVDGEQGRDLEDVIAEVLGLLPAPLAVWEEVRAAGGASEIFCGAFFRTSLGSQGLGFSPGLLKALGDRGIELSIDLYVHEDG